MLKIMFKVFGEIQRKDLSGSMQEKGFTSIKSSTNPGKDANRMFINSSSICR